MSVLYSGLFSCKLVRQVCIIPSIPLHNEFYIYEQVIMVPSGYNVDEVLSIFYYNWIINIVWIGRVHSRCPHAFNCAYVKTVYACIYVHLVHVLFMQWLLIGYRPIPVKLYNHVNIGLYLSVTDITGGEKHRYNKNCFWLYWNRFFKKLIVAQLVNKFHVFYVTRILITVFTRTRHRSLPLSCWIQAIYSHLTFATSPLILSYHAYPPYVFQVNFSLQNLQVKIFFARCSCFPCMLRVPSHPLLIWSS
jgi:hypothetical protein